jgi:hypothetical protein
MGFATLVSWLVTASMGAFMLRTWLARGGLSRERARAGGLPPQLIFGHMGLAITGLLIWSAFVATGARPLAWTAVGVLMVTVGLGLCTVMLWTPYPARNPGERRKATPWDKPALVVPDTAEFAADTADTADTRDSGDPLTYEVTDEMIARFLEAPFPGARHRPVRPIRLDPAVLVPVAHGFAAIGTFILAVMAVSM